MKRSCIWSKHYHCYEFILHPSSRFRSYRLIEIQNGYLFIRRYVQDSYFTSFSKVGYHSGTLGWWLPCNIRDTLVLRECNQEPRGRKVCFFKVKNSNVFKVIPAFEWWWGCVRPSMRSGAGRVLVLGTVVNPLIIIHRVLVPFIRWVLI